MTKVLLEGREAEGAINQTWAWPSCADIEKLCLGFGHKQDTRANQNGTPIISARSRLVSEL